MESVLTRFVRWGVLVNGGTLLWDGETVMPEIFGTRTEAEFAAKTEVKEPMAGEPVLFRVTLERLSQ